MGFDLGCVNDEVSAKYDMISAIHKLAYLVFGARVC